MLLLLNGLDELIGRFNPPELTREENIAQARIEEVVQELEPLQITTILWSFGKLNFNPGIELMEVLLAAISLNISHFATQVSDQIDMC